MKYAVEVNQVTVGYDKKAPILSQVTCVFPVGHLCAVVGPNGAGKTTLLKAMTNVLVPFEGEIKRQGTYAYVPQSASVDWTFPLTVFDVVVMGTYGRLRFYQRPGEQEKKDVLDALGTVGLAMQVDTWIGALSGGQRQRVLLARALVQGADTIFLDEPFVGIDKPTEDVMLGVFKNLVASGKTLIWVHHDIMTVKKVSDWVVLVNRAIIAQGAAQDVLTPDLLSRTYGGYIG